MAKAKKTAKKKAKKKALEGTVVETKDTIEVPDSDESPLTPTKSGDVFEAEAGEEDSPSEMEFQKKLKDKLDKDMGSSEVAEFNDLNDTNDANDTDTDSESLLPVVSPSQDWLPAKTGRGVDPLTQYLRQISRYELLSPEKEKALAKLLSETGDIDAAKKLVLSNLRLVVKIAMEYRYAYPNVMDLVQEGNIGLMKAVSKYDLSKGAKLSYYASWWIRSYILKFILDNFRLVKIGTTNEQKKLFYNLLKEKDRLISLGIEPDTKTISENLGVSEKSVQVMSKRLSPSGGEVSLDKPLLSDDSGRSTYGDLLASERESDDIETQLADAQSLDILKTHLKDFVEQLKPRDKEIFKQRLLSEVPPSLQSLADEYGVSRERIRQIEDRLLKNLKVYMSEYLS